MNLEMKNYIFLALAVALVMAVLVIMPKPDREEPAVTVDSFEECWEAGYPIAESFPRQCRTPDGRVFIEDVSENPEVVVDTPGWGETVSSPLKVAGMARGNWFFEANLPVTLKDSKGNILAQKGAQALGDWMTEDYVEFSVTLEFMQPETEFGTLLIEKDNPSGLEEYSGSYAVPVRFK